MYFTVSVRYASRFNSISVCYYVDFLKRETRFIVSCLCNSSTKTQLIENILMTLTVSAASSEHFCSQFRLVYSAH